MKVGFIGLGTMGASMAANLQKAGYELVVHDIRRAADVVDDQLIAGLLQVRRHAGAHRAEPDETDLHCILLQSIVTAPSPHPWRFARDPLPHAGEGRGPSPWRWEG